MSKYYSTESIQVDSITYEERIAREPSIRAATGEFVSGIEQLESVSIELSNSDKAITFFRLSKDLRGKPVIIKELYRSTESQDVYDIHSVYRGVISATDISPLSAVFTCIPGDFAVLDTTFPVEKVTVDKFPDAIDLDVPIPYVIGTAKKVPLALIKAYEDVSGNQYQYLVGRGDLTVDVVYRDGRVIKEYSGTAQGGASNYITLSATDTKSDDFYNNAFVEIVSGTGAGQVRKIVDYVASTKRAYVDTDWTTPPDDTSVYVIREWKKVVLTINGVTYTAVEFAIAQRERGKLFTRREMSADVTGLQAERNPARAVRSILELAGAAVDVTSFTQAEADINAIGNLFVDGAVVEERQLYDVISELCLIGRILLGVNDSGQFTARIDNTQTDIFGILSTDNNIAEITGIRETPLDSVIGTLEIAYRKLFDEREHRLRASRVINSQVNRIQTLEFDFIYDKTTADKVCDYLAKRKKLLDSVIAITTGLDARDRQLLDLVYLKIPELNTSGVYQIIGISRRSFQASLDLIKYDSNTFAYEAGTLPADPVTDAPADFRFTPPDPVTNLSLSWTLVQSSYTATATLTWTNPTENFKEVIVEYKKSSDTLYNTFTITNGTSVEIPGLIPGLNYDFRLTSVNEFDLQGGIATLLNQLAPGDATAPSTPTGLTGPASDETRIDSITWKWNANTEEDIEGYEVEVWTAVTGGTKKATAFIPQTESPAYTFPVPDQNLAAVKTYYLQVRARDFSGNVSGWTSKVIGQTRGIGRDDLLDNSTFELGSFVNNGLVTFSLPNNWYDIASVTITTVGKTLTITASAYMKRELLLELSSR
ncbi:MAG: hypothetical protein KatS3mg078_2039 [Deltaproteobacteria bacterium]|nr:MAG: hypothetical protein KatS3mg078_2039 [Deltaproteobacteria bacterium]